MNRTPAPGRDERGQTLILILVVTAIAMSLFISLASWTALTLRAARQTMYREQALLIAEAGQEYYRWHLAHYPADFQDGTGAAGPYIHSYMDGSGAVIGTFTLDITAPPTGSTLVTIKSTGSPSASPGTRRAVTVQLGKPSWARYAVVANAAMRFGAGTEIFGAVHSNGGIRFDGLTHNIITSAVSSYDDPDHSGGNEFGVHTHLSPVDPLPPAAVPSRTDVFEAGRTFPVPAVDFNGVTSDLATIKTLAQSDGRYFAASGGLGYHVVLKTDDTFDLYRVTSVSNAPSNCTNSLSESGWGTWSIAAQTSLGNYAFPNNGLIFTEDHLWIDGTVNTARLTVGAASFPENSSTYRSIIVNSNLKYTNYDGQDAVALIAQNNFNVGLASADNLGVDAAVIAQKGRAGRYHYTTGTSHCGSNAIRNTLTLYGMLGTSLRYGFAWTDGSGYATRNLNYDGRLLYAPPPNFPLTSDQYQIVSWREVNP